MTQRFQGQLAVIPGSHNAKMALPPEFSQNPELMSIAVEVNARPGTAILFHQGTLHTSTPNYRPYNRYIQHVRRQVHQQVICLNL